MLTVGSAGILPDDIASQRIVGIGWESTASGDNEFILAAGVTSLGDLIAGICGDIWECGTVFAWICTWSFDVYDSTLPEGRAGGNIIGEQRVLTFRAKFNPK